MPNIPTLNELADNALHHLQSAFTDATQGDAAASALALQNNKVIAFVNAVGVHSAYQYLRDHIAPQQVPITSSGNFLNAWLSTYGMQRKAGETDGQAIARLQHRLSNPPMGGAPHDYVQWALSIEGITRAWCIRNIAGSCTVGVIVMTDGVANHGLPDATHLQAVRDYILNPARGPADELFVLAPEPIYIDITLRLTPDTPANRQAVDLELRDLFFREGDLGADIPHSHLAEAVAVSGTEYDHEFITPQITSGGAFSVPDRGIAILRNVSFANG